ncbi:MAG: undecaprenyl-diphosphatase UppP [Candidatus Moranbacteria bacterium]|nr:undecaprenyl-diphosphatase UppP [Candidatus Moranbacteria bacterium]
MLEQVIQPLILGIVQGLGEFLPVSSTAHLILAPYFFHWEDPGLAFDVALHLGTLIALLAFFWRDWLCIFELAFKNKVQSSRFKVQSYGNNILWLIVAATIPGILAGYFLENSAERSFRSPILVALMLAVFGLFLYLTDKYSRGQKNLGQVSWRSAIFIGIAQAIAIIPGVSRSGITITGGLLAGLDRVSAARFSFLLSTPIIFGAVIFKITDLFESGMDKNILIGILAAAISGYLAIKYLLKFIERVKYGIFFWYRLALAIVIIFSAIYFK